MKRNSTISKIGLLALTMIAINFGAYATTFTATSNGDFTNTATWSGGIAPGTTITGADQIIINTGVAVNMDQDITFNNVLSSISINGSLTGTTSLYMLAGTIGGTGTLTVHYLTMAGTSTSSFAGTMTVDNLSNAEAVLTLGGNIQVNDTLGLFAGYLNLGNSATLTFGNNATLNLGGGSYNVGNGSISQLGTMNLIYSRSGTSTMGVEINLTNINDITVTLGSTSDQLKLSADLVATGQLFVQRGYLDLNNHNLTISGSVNVGTNGAFMSTSSSDLTVNGGGNVGTMYFATGSNTVGHFTLNAGTSGYLYIASDLTADSGIALTSGTLKIGANTFTVNGHIVGTGSFSTNDSTNLSINGAGMIGPLNIKADSTGAHLNNLSLHADSGSLSLGANLVIRNALSISAGTLEMSGNSITLYGTSSMTGTGSLTGHGVSDLTLSGPGAMGTLTFAVGGGVLRNLTMNGTSATTITLNSDLNVNSVLNLAAGKINLIGSSDLTVVGSDSINGGSASSYVATSGTGSLVVNIANSSNNVRTLPIGTQASYAPVRIGNYSTTAGNFHANAHSGIFSNGTSGVDLSATLASVSTSWNVESDISTGANVSIETYWSRPMEVNLFDENNVYLSHFTTGRWDTMPMVQSTAQANSMYSVKRTGITSFSPFAVYSSPLATGIAETEKPASFNTYPNPAKNTVTVSITDPIANSDIKVYDVLGNQVAVYPVSGTSNRLDITSLQSGVYLMSINNKYTQKFIKQ